MQGKKFLVLLDTGKSTRYILHSCSMQFYLSWFPFIGSSNLVLPASSCKQCPQPLSNGSANESCLDGTFNQFCGCDAAVLLDLSMLVPWNSTVNAGSGGLICNPAASYPVPCIIAPAVLKSLNPGNVCQSISPDALGPFFGREVEVVGAPAAVLLTSQCYPDRTGYVYQPPPKSI